MPTVDLYRTTTVASSGTVVSAANLNSENVPDSNSVAVFGSGGNITINIDDLDSTDDGDVTGDIASIDQVQIQFAGYGDTTGTLNIIVGLQDSGGSNFNGYTQTISQAFGAGAGNIVAVSATATTTSDGSSAFTQSDINGARIFFDFDSRTSGTLSFLGVDYVRLRVTYTELAVSVTPPTVFKMNGGNLIMNGGNLKINR